VVVAGAGVSPNRGVVALGVVTITAYGSWFYGFGVLLEIIAEDTGWSTTMLGFTFGAAQFITGVGAFVGGRLLDRFGGIGPFGVQALGGGGLMLASTWATTGWTFALLYAIGGGITGATGFYHVTTAAAARLRPDQPDRAISRVTIIGAFASPIVLPLAAWYAGNEGWRPTMRILAVAAILGAASAAWFARKSASPPSAGPSVSPLSSVKTALANPGVRHMLIVYAAVGLAFSSVLVYQVPVLIESGLSLKLAGTIGGVRGFCQIFGRLGLGRAVERHGARRLLRVAYLGAAVGVSTLLLGGIGPAIGFALLTGVAFGALTPLQAMYARLHFDPTDLGLLMGLQGAALGVSGALGPIIGGTARDLTGSWMPTIALSVAALLFGTWFMGRPVVTSGSRPPTAEQVGS